MSIIRVSIDDRAVSRILSILENHLGDKVAAKSTFEAARLAKLIARELVPVDTRKTKNAILSVIKLKNNNVAEARVGFNRNPHPEKVWLGGSFNLPAWMTYSKKALSHPWRSGQPRFLLIAAGEAGKELRKQVKTNTGNLLNA